MVELSSPPPVRPSHEALQPLWQLAELGQELEGALAGVYAHGNGQSEIARFRFLGPEASHPRIRLGLFAGVHGDEPAGPVALARFAAALAADPQRAAGYELWLYPICNPCGCAKRVRENGNGCDLNREFWRESTQPEVVILEAELRQRRFDGLITLHTDDTCEGLYGYAHGRVLNEALLKPALAAAERVLPRDRREHIDGFVACESVIRDCFPGVLAAPPEQHPRPFDLIFETPGKADFELQVQATVAALDSILAEYRGFIAYAQDI